MARLTLDAVQKAFGAHLALRDVSIDIGDGEFVAILGPSGCGKTTMLRLIAGFESPDRGEITINERPVANSGSSVFVPPEERNLGIVFQSYALWPHMSVAGNVGYPLKVRGSPLEARRRRVGEALEVVGMSHLAQRNPAELSGGQRQRVALARCLVMEPGAVLLDEPLANLDVHLRSAMQDAFADFHRRTGATMVYVTHDQTEAMAMADRIAVMQDGEILQLASPEDIYHRPVTPEVARFVGAGVVLPAEELSAGNGEFATVNVGGAAVAGRLASNGSAAGRYCISLRPEHVRIDAEGDIEMQVTSCTYLGERFLLNLTGRQIGELMAYAPRRATPGDRLRVSIGDGWILPDRAG